MLFTKYNLILCHQKASNKSIAQMSLMMEMLTNQLCPCHLKTVISNVAEAILAQWVFSLLLQEGGRLGSWIAFPSPPEHES